jgi:hypothetical protein
MIIEISSHINTASDKANEIAQILIFGLLIAPRGEYQPRCEAGDLEKNTKVPIENIVLILLTTQHDTTVYVSALCNLPSKIA